MHIIDILFHGACLAVVLSCLATPASAGWQWARNNCATPSGNRWCTDFVNQALVADGYSSTGTRGAEAAVNTLLRRGWTRSRYFGSCPDGSVIYYRRGLCSDFISSDHVAMCYNNHRYQWNPSRCGASVSWSICIPDILSPPSGSHSGYGSVPSCFDSGSSTDEWRSANCKHHY